MSARVLAVVGPTASGKSAVAMQVATSDPSRTVEIVAVDAFTVYQGMDIGTAKPSPRDREQVRHHLVDVIDPTESLTVADFQGMARRAVDDVHGRGGTPLLVGGSGLYFRAVVDDLRFPPTDPSLRAELEERWEQDPGAAWRRLEDRDPAAAAKIDPANLRRTVRALEVLELTGEPFSSFAAAWDRYDSIYPALEVAYLEPPTEVLRRRIEDRSHAMVAAGLLGEARSLRSLDRSLSRTARQAIGYREAFAVLDGELPEEELAGAVADRTWSYARRQRSWFRRDPRCEPTDPAEVVERFAT